MALKDPMQDTRKPRVEPPSLAGPILGLVGGLFTISVIAVAGGGGKKKPSKNGTSQDSNQVPKHDTPPGEDIPPANVPPATSDPRYPDLQLIDMRAKSPPERILRMRTLLDVTAVVLHQTSFFGWKDTNPLWPKIKAHFVVRRDGRVQINYDPEVRMTTGSNDANSFCITIECEGNYPNSNGNFYQPDKFGRSYIADAPNQVASGRKLVEALHELCPKMTAIFAHTQWTDNRENCCGPDLWRSIGQWAVDELALTDGGPGWKWGTGSPIPNSWRGENV